VYGGKNGSKPLYHFFQVCGLKWSHDDRELASGGNDNQVKITTFFLLMVPIRFH
jgi:WD40 repeat protein